VASRSGYLTPNTTPRGAYGDTVGDTGRFLLDTEFRYRVPDTGLLGKAMWVGRLVAACHRAPKASVGAL
jgi:hypothetical protein